MKEELVSIIVPVYKVENYIKECIDSIICQTYKNIEIILVDDGSPDKCSQICDYYATKDSRIRVFHKKNGGLSDARNYGIDKANGKYISFIDSDDYIEKNMIEMLYDNIMKYKADISICDYSYLFKNKFIKNDLRTNLLVMNAEEAIKELNKQNSFGFAAWNKMYKKDMFKKLKFPKGKINEDCFIMYKVFAQASKIVYQPEAKYYYRQRNSSISKNNEINYNPILAASRCRKFVSIYYRSALYETYGNEIIADITVYNRLINKKKEKLKKNYIKQRIKTNLYLMGNPNSYFKRLKTIQIYLLIYFPKIYRIMYCLHKKTDFFE